MSALRLDTKMPTHPEIASRLEDPGDAAVHDVPRPHVTGSLRVIHPAYPVALEIAHHGLGDVHREDDGWASRYQRPCRSPGILEATRQGAPPAEYSHDDLGNQPAEGRPRQAEQWPPERW